MEFLIAAKRHRFETINYKVEAWKQHQVC